MSVVADNRYGLSIGGRFQPIRHIGLIGLDAEAMSQDDPITSGLSSVNLGRRGLLRARRRRHGEADAAARRRASNRRPCRPSGSSSCRTRPSS